MFLGSYEGVVSKQRQRLLLRSRSLWRVAASAEPRPRQPTSPVRPAFPSSVPAASRRRRDLRSEARDLPCCPMSAAPAYSEDKGGSAGPGEPEYGHDPASGGIFSSDYKR
ncbi:hypothetical protein J1605_017093 [Eschrichtius robustus]|uniref:Uncharacterized protein n=1 Tax=Eschrichtius robustus TaxID=9764 RepID=A0AB34HYL8_ESCRO|nr:hypothetical protein J1605_017093 [Eschrichtius robustus]